MTPKPRTCKPSSVLPKWWNTNRIPSNLSAPTSTIFGRLLWNSVGTGRNANMPLDPINLPNLSIYPALGPWDEKICCLYNPERLSFYQKRATTSMSSFVIDDNTFLPWIANVDYDVSFIWKAPWMNRRIAMACIQSHSSWPHATKRWTRIILIDPFSWPIKFAPSRINSSFSTNLPKTITSTMKSKNFYRIIFALPWTRPPFHFWIWMSFSNAKRATFIANWNDWAWTQKAFPRLLEENGPMSSGIVRVSNRPWRIAKHMIDSGKRGRDEKILWIMDRTNSRSRQTLFTILILRGTTLCRIPTLSRGIQQQQTLLPPNAGVSESRPRVPCRSRNAKHANVQPI